MKQVMGGKDDGPGTISRGGEDVRVNAASWGASRRPPARGSCCRVDASPLLPPSSLPWGSCREGGRDLLQHPGAISFIPLIAPVVPSGSPGASSRPARVRPARAWVRLAPVPLLRLLSSCALRARSQS